MSRRVPKNPCPRVVDEYPRAMVTLAHSSAEDILVCKVVLVVKTPLHSKMQIINKVNNVRQRNLGFWAERGKVGGNRYRNAVSRNKVMSEAEASS